MKLYKKIREVQKSIGKMTKGKTNPFYKSKYFDINDLLEKLDPCFNEQKIVVIQPLDSIDAKPAIRTKVIDLESDAEISFVTILPDNLDAQKMGGAITYYRRYSLQSLFCLQAEDDDANTASGKTKALPEIEI